MKELRNIWKDGFDFFFATKWSEWIKPDQLEQRFKFNRRTIWITRYLVSIPVVFAPFTLVVINYDWIISSAANGTISSTSTTAMIFGVMTFCFVVYPAVLFAAYLRWGIIKRR